MKTLNNFYQTIFALAMTFLTITAFASNNLNSACLSGCGCDLDSIGFDFGDEAYIDDIPFDTHYVSALSATISTDEEAYIADIPFNTEVIAINTALSAFDFDEESIDDIPFDTHRIVANYKYERALDQRFEFSTEDNINDIPYDTYCIVHNEEGSNCALNIVE